MQIFMYVVKNDQLTASHQLMFRSPLSNSINSPFWVLNYSYFVIAKRFHKWKQMCRISKLSDIWISFKLCQAVHELCSWPFLGCSFCYMWHIEWKINLWLYPGRTFQDICYYSANLYFSISSFHRMSPDKCGIK